MEEVGWVYGRNIGASIITYTFWEFLIIAIVEYTPKPSSNC